MGREDASIWRAIALVSQEFWPGLADAISCWKGATLTVPYKKMNGNFFAQLNKEPFYYSVWSGKAEMQEDSTYLMDNDPDKQACEEGPRGYAETDMRSLFA